MKLSNGSISLLKAETNGWNTTFVLEFFKRREAPNYNHSGLLYTN